MPIFDLLERLMIKRLNFPPGVALRLITLTIYVGNLFNLYILSLDAGFFIHDPNGHNCIAAFTLFIGVTFPFFGDLLGFFGGFGFAPTSYFVSSSYQAFFSIHPATLFILKNKTEL